MKIGDFNYSAGGSVVRWFGGSGSIKNHRLRHMVSYGSLGDKRKCFEYGVFESVEVKDE